jgi:hypothetical protein
LAKATAFSRSAGLNAIPSAYAMEAYMSNPSILSTTNPAMAAPTSVTSTTAASNLGSAASAAQTISAEPPLSKLQKSMDDYFNRHQAANATNNIPEPILAPTVSMPSTSAVVGSVIASIGLNPRTPGRVPASSGIIPTPIRIAQQNTARKVGMIVQDLMLTPKASGAKRLFSGTGVEPMIQEPRLDHPRPSESMRVMSNYMNLPTRKRIISIQLTVSRF